MDRCSWRLLPALLAAYFFCSDCDFGEYDKPGAERSRRRRGEDDDLER